MRVLDKNGAILESHDIGAEAPISTPNGSNDGAFRGVSHPSADIAAIEFLITGVMVIDDLAFSQTPAPVEAQPPVILIHGWCGSPKSFGIMAELLEEKLKVPVRSFDYSDWSGIPAEERTSIEKVAGHFARFLNEAAQDLKTSQFDIVAHSMGGLVVRAWMTGMVDAQTGTGGLAYQSGVVRRVVFAATPHYGVDAGTKAEQSATAFFADHNCDNPKARAGQTKELQYGNKFLKTLHDQLTISHNVLPTINNILFIVGCGSQQSEECVTDHAVQIASAVIPPNNQDLLIRYVPKDHLTLPSFNPSLHEGIVDIQDSLHPTFKLLNAFLSTGTALSQTDIGFTPTLIKSLTIINLIQKNGTPYTGKVWDITVADCIDFFLRDFLRFDSKDQSGWITLVDVPGNTPPACRNIDITLPRTFLSPPIFQIFVPAGRPVFVDPVKVRPKR